MSISPQNNLLSSYNDLTIARQTLRLNQAVYNANQLETRSSIFAIEFDRDSVLEMLELATLRARIADEMFRLEIMNGLLVPSRSLSAELFNFYDQFDPFDLDDIAKLQELLAISANRELASNVVAALNDVNPEDEFSIYPFNWALYQFLIELDAQLYPRQLSSKERADQLLGRIYNDVLVVVEEFKSTAYLIGLEKSILDSMQDRPIEGDLTSTQNLDNRFFKELFLVYANRAWEFAVEMFNQAFPHTGLSAELQSVLNNCRLRYDFDFSEGSIRAELYSDPALLDGLDVVELKLNLLEELKRLDCANPISCLIICCSLYGMLLEHEERKSEKWRQLTASAAIISSNSLRLGWQRL